MIPFTVAIEPDGLIRFLYRDDLRPLLLEGAAALSRASYVEPIDIQWTADLSPVGGPVLGPFPTREQALIEEADWIHHHRL